MTPACEAWCLVVALSQLSNHMRRCTCLKVHHGFVDVALRHVGRHGAFCFRCAALERKGARCVGLLSVSPVIAISPQIIMAYSVAGRV
jgi:hypothetical protein